MKRRGGLTLLEVLAATVLLSMLAAACLPLLTRACAELAGESEPDDSFELARLADAFMLDPSKFGVKDVVEHEPFQIQWPEDFGDEHLRAATIRCLQASEPGFDHAWLIFECEGQSVSRWVNLPRERQP